MAIITSIVRFTNYLSHFAIVQSYLNCLLLVKLNQLQVDYIKIEFSCFDIDYFVEYNWTKKLHLGYLHCSLQTNFPAQFVIKHDHHLDFSYSLVQILNFCFLVVLDWIEECNWITSIFAIDFHYSACIILMKELHLNCHIVY